MGNGAHKKWSNCIGNQQVAPFRLLRPTTLDEIVEIVKLAESQNRKVRAVGSGHSFSDIAITEDYLLDTHGLNKVLPLDDEVLKDGAMPLTILERRIVERAEAAKRG